jgi:GH24 family phage-related lysozyme (muramidase)
MKLSAEGAGFIRTHEGFVGKYYLDPVGIPTIGVGFTWRSSSFREWWKKNKGGSPFQPGATITRSQADDALRFLVEREYGKAVNNFLGKSVPQHVFDGMVSPVFNLGAGSLKWKWAAAAKKGEYAASAELLRSTGTTAQGKKLRGLVSRRIEEAELIEHGDYTVGKLHGRPSNILKRGERGQKVKELQMDLTQLHIYDGAIDGIFGFGTEAAVMDFQREQRLTVDGYAGPRTLKALEAATEGAKLGASKPPKTTKPSPRTPKRGAGGIVGLIATAVVAFVVAASGVGQQILEAIQGMIQ